MNRVVMALMEILAAAVVLVPIYLLLNRYAFRNAGKSVIYCVFSFYLVAVYALVGMPNITYLRFDISGNLIPVLGLLRDLKNSALNVLLFVPLGLLLPMIWDKYRIGRETVLFGFGMSAAIELLQILTYRATDINDLLTNTLGTALGFLLGKRILRRFPKAARGEDAYELFLVCLIVLVVMFFVQPFISQILWDGVLY